MATVAKSIRSTTITLADASAGPFDLDFRLFDDDGLTVYVNGIPTTDFDLESNYSDGFDDHATITFREPQAAGSRIVIDSDLAPRRETDFINGPGLTEKMNNELARVWSTLSDIKRDTKRSVRFVEEIRAYDLPTDDRSLKVLGFDFYGNLNAFDLDLEVLATFTSRNMLRDWIEAGNRPVDGQLYSAADRIYIGKAYSTLIDDMPGLEPALTWTKEHFGGNEATVRFLVPSQFPTVQEALDHVSSFVIGEGISIEVFLESGFVWPAQVSVFGGDYSRVYIRSADPVVYTASDFPIGHALIAFLYCKTPNWEVLVDMELRGDNGVELNISEMRVLDRCGIMRAGARSASREGYGSCFLMLGVSRLFCDPIRKTVLTRTGYTPTDGPVTTTTGHTAADGLSTTFALAASDQQPDDGYYIGYEIVVTNGLDPSPAMIVNYDSASNTVTIDQKDEWSQPNNGSGLTYTLQFKASTETRFQLAAADQQPEDGYYTSHVIKVTGGADASEADIIDYDSATNTVTLRYADRWSAPNYGAGLTYQIDLLRGLIASGAARRGVTPSWASVFSLVAADLRYNGTDPRNPGHGGIFCRRGSSGQLDRSIFSFSACGIRASRSNTVSSREAYFCRILGSCITAAENAVVSAASSAFLKSGLATGGDELPLLLLSSAEGRGGSGSIDGAAGEFDYAISAVARIDAEAGKIDLGDARAFEIEGVLATGDGGEIDVTRCNGSTSIVAGSPHVCLASSLSASIPALGFKWNGQNGTSYIYRAVNMGRGSLANASLSNADLELLDIDEAAEVYIENTTLDGEVAGADDGFVWRPNGVVPKRSDAEIVIRAGAFPGNEVPMWIQGFGYKGKATSTAIPSMKDMVPLGISYPEHFGAVGNGVADDTDAIAAWMAFGVALAATPGAVYRCSSVVSGDEVLAVDAATIDFAGATFIFEETDLGSTARLQFGAGCRIQNAPALIWTGLSYDTLYTADRTYANNTNLVASDFSMSGDFSWKLDCTVPASPSGVCWEIGGASVYSALVFTGGDVVFRAGDGASGTPENAAVVRVPYATAFDGASLEGRTGTFFGAIDASESEVSLWFYDAELDKLALIGSASASGSFASWAGASTGHVGGTNHAMAGEDNTDFNGDISELSVYDDAFLIPEGSFARRRVELAAGVEILSGQLKVSSANPVLQSSVVTGNGHDTAVKLIGDGIKGAFSFNNVWRCIDVDPEGRAHNCDLKIYGENYDSLFSGHHRADGSFIDVSAGKSSPYGSKTAGSNVTSGASPNQVVKGGVTDSANEHGHYEAYEGRLPTGDLMPGLIHRDQVVRSSGGCGFKWRGLLSPILTNLVAMNQSFGSASGANEDGYRMEECDQVFFSDLVNGNADGAGTGGYYGAVFDSCPRVRGAGLQLYHSQAHPIYINDKRVPGSVKDIHLSGIKVGGTSKTVALIKTSGRLGAVTLMIDAVEANTGQSLVEIDVGYLADLDASIGTTDTQFSLTPDAGRTVVDPAYPANDPHGAYDLRLSGTETVEVTAINASYLDGAVSAGATSITVQDASGFPDPATFGNYAIELDIPWAVGSTEEVVTVTGKSGNTLTITACQNAHASGVYVRGNVVTVTRHTSPSSHIAGVGVARAKFNDEGKIHVVAPNCENVGTLINEVHGGPEVRVMAWDFGKLHLYDDGKELVLEGDRILIGGNQVLGPRLPNIGKLDLSASTGTLPTATGTVVLADAAAPTNAELLAICVELASDVDALIQRSRDQGQIGD